MLQEYLERLNTSEDKEQELTTILKEQTPFWLRVVDVLLMTTLLILVIFMQINGYYNRTEITIEQCMPVLDEIEGYGEVQWTNLLQNNEIDLTDNSTNSDLHGERTNNERQAIS